MAEAQNPCEINPAEGDENLALAQGAGLITNIIPSVGFESVTLETVNIPSQEEVEERQERPDPELPTTDILLNLSFVEGIKGEEAARWYDDAQYTQYLRLRVIGCLNQSLSHAFDFTTQRFNEYGAGLMDTSGPEGASQFLQDFKAAAFGTILPDDSPSNFPLGTQVDNIMAASGPFDTQEMTRTFKNSNNPIQFFPSFVERDDPYGVSSTMVYDSSIQNLMMTDEDGNVVRQTTNRVLPASIPGQNEETMYLMEKAFLYPIRIRIGPGVQLPPGVQSAPEQDYEITDQLSFYAYMYFDYDLFMEELGLNPNDIEMDHTGLSSGMGFINPGIYLGTQARFPLQEEGNPPLPPNGMTQVAAKNGGSLQDVRNTVLIKAPPIDKSLFRTTKMILDSSGFNKETVKVIKDRDHISPLWLSKDNTDSARYTFAFDKRNFLSENSVLPSLYKNRAAAEELILGGNILLPEETAKVISMNMYKRRIDFEGEVGLEGGLTIGKIIPSSDNLRTPKKLILGPGTSVLRNITLEDNTLGIDMYEGFDSYAENFKASDVIRYQYGVEYKIHDPSYLFLKRVSVMLDDAQNLILRLYNNIVNSIPLPIEDRSGALTPSNGVGLYDARSNRITAPLSDILLSRGESSVSYENIVIEQVEIYSSLIMMFSSITSNQKQKITSDLIAMANSTNPEGLREVSLIIKEFCTMVYNLLDRFLPGDTFNQGSIEKSKIFIKDGKNLTLEGNFDFKETFEYGVKHGCGYDYVLGPDVEAEGVYPPAGIPRIPRSAMDQRVQDEFNKYFDFYIKDDQASADPRGTSYADSAYKFFTPRTVFSYGHSPIEQLSYKNEVANVNEYDLNRYGKLLADIITTSRRSKFLSYPYAYVQNNTEKDPANLQLENSLGVSLSDHSCRFFTSNGISMPSYDPTLEKGEEDKVKDTAKKIITPPKDIFPIIMGKGKNNFLEKNTEQTNKNEFKTDNNPKEGKKVVQEDGPIKLMFAILGELELDKPIVPATETKYQRKDFNSLSKRASRLSLTPDNAREALETAYQGLPNQIKSSMIAAVATERLEFGDGFDAVRPFLGEAEEPDVRNYYDKMSAVLDGGSFPPYQFISDPMKTYAKFLAFWLNYKQLGVVEYLASFEVLDSPQGQGFPTVRRPVWNTFTEDLYFQKYDKDILCRVRPYSSVDLLPADLAALGGIEKNNLLDLPLYNQYFVLQGGSLEDIEAPVIQANKPPNEEQISQRISNTFEPVEQIKQQNNAIAGVQQVVQNVVATPSANNISVAAAGVGQQNAGVQIQGAGNFQY